MFTSHEVCNPLLRVRGDNASGIQTRVQFLDIVQNLYIFVDGNGTNDINQNEPELQGIAHELSFEQAGCGLTAPSRQFRDTDLRLRLAVS